MREEGLKNTETLQGWFTNRIIDFLKSKGRKPIVWNESLKSGVIEKSVLVQRWMDPKNYSSSFTKDGGKIINSDFYHYYCDYPYYMTPLEKTYNVDPILKGIAPVMQKHVIGVEVPLWTEYVCDFDKLCYMFFPRIAAVAEVGWSKKENLNCTDFEKRFRKITPLLNSIGIHPAKPEEWNPTPIQRLTGTVKFFSSRISVDIIKSSLNNGKK
jgi:hexosaminidase